MQFTLTFLQRDVGLKLLLSEFELFLRAVLSVCLIRQVLNVFLDCGHQIVAPPLRRFGCGEYALLRKLLNAANCYSEQLCYDLHPVHGAACDLAFVIQTEKPPPADSKI